MKKILLSLTLILGFAGIAYAQPSFQFGSVVKNTGEEACIQVTVQDFTEITSVKMPIFWDTAVLTFKSVRPNTRLRGFDLPDFSTTRTKDGLLLLDWSAGNCAAGEAGTLNDDEVLFELCFTVKGNYADASSIGITEDTDLLKDPEPVIIRRTSACALNIYYDKPNTTVGSVAVGVRPIKLIASNATGNTGDNVIINVTTSGFDALSSLQFSINYDSTFLEFAGVTPLDNLRNLSSSSFGRPDDPNGRIKKGNITFSWSVPPSEVGRGISVEDGKVIFQLNFKIIGPCGKSSSVSFSGKPTLLEAINVAREGAKLPVVGQPGVVTSTACDPPGLKVGIDCGQPVAQNTEVCVKVIANENFPNITFLDYVMEWNPTQLKFKSISTNDSPIPRLTESFFNTDNTANGVLGLKWESPVPSTAQRGATLYTVCFTAIGLSNSSLAKDSILLAPIKLNRETATVKRRGEDTNYGLAPRNCNVQIKQPPGVRIQVAAQQGKPGETICSDVQVGSFRDVLKLQFSMIWNNADLKFVELKDLNTTALPGLNLSAFNLTGAASGLLTMEYTNNTPITLTDATTIFKFCYQIIGKGPGELGQENNCQTISFANQPLKSGVTTPSSNGQIIELVPQDGDVCILNPSGYFISLGKNEGYLNDQVCVDFKVAEFKNIAGTQFNVKWPTAALKLISATNTGALPELKIDTASAKVGLLKVDYQKAAGGNLDDSTSIIRACFQLIGEPNNCHKIDINAEPNPSVSLVGGGVGSVFQKAGSICIQDTILLLDTTITQVTCPGGRNGTIEVQTKGGTGNVFYNWEVFPRGGNPVQFTPKAINLPAGKVVLRVFDSRRPTPLVRVDTFNIPESKEVPSVNAGPDQVMPCTLPALAITGTASQGADIKYDWSARFGGINGDRDKLRVLVTSAGEYILNVTNTKTGCFSVDTVKVSNPALPIANAGRDLIFGCKTDSLFLDAGLSSKGDTVTYKWVQLNDGVIKPGDETKVNPKIEKPGRFALEVRFRSTGCVARDTVDVTRSTVVLKAVAGTDLTLDCKGGTVTLDGSRSVNSSQVTTYEWLKSDNTVISRGPQTVQVRELGTYFLRVTDEGEGCISMDTVEVKPSPDFPTIKGSKDLVLSCKSPNPELKTTISNAARFSARWTTSAGGQLKAGTDTTLNAVATQAGTFVLAVTNLESTCISRDTVVVTTNLNKPAVDIVNSTGNITCAVPSLTLTATAATGRNVVLTWKLAGQDVAKDSLRFRITKGGTYFLEARDTASGCFSLDSVRIAQQAEIPQIVITNPGKITCRNPQLTLRSTVTPAANTYTYTWQKTQGTGTINSGGNTASPVIRGVGSFSVKVNNPTTGCVGEGNITIEGDTLRPTAQAGPDKILDCKADSLILDGTGSSAGTKFTYAWTVSGASAPNPANRLQVTVRQPGNYALTVRDTSNGCFRVDSIRVTSDRNAPTVSIATPTLLTCAINSINLVATGSSGNNFRIGWTGPNGQAIPAGNNALQLPATQVGKHEITITNTQNSCSTKASVEVRENRTRPTVQVVRSASVTCATAKATLNGTGSASGTGISYRWVVARGNGSISSGETTLNPQITGPGVYRLVVSSQENGCQSRDSVEVKIDQSALGLAKVTKEPNSVCDDEVNVIGNSLTGTTGQWTGPAGISFEAPTQASTVAMGLPEGKKTTLRWSLSTAECPNYSFDTLSVIHEGVPNANNDKADRFVASLDKPTTTLNVARNDQVNGTGFKLNIEVQPSLGRIDTISGGFITYRALPGRAGMDMFKYKICNVQCPTKCDTATVTLDVDVDDSFQFQVPNGITPNADGKNDALKFEILDVNPDKYPNSELIIFNRWGDIVYQVKPYANDWQGTNNAGQELPTGTYYYILRLDIANGEILKGDVTIVK